MNTSSVGLQDYAGLRGFGGPEDIAEIAELRKAISAGSDINSPGAVPGSGFALRPESLEATLKVTTFNMDDAVLWQNVTKLPAFNTIEEHNRLESYGAGVAAFVGEGDLPEADDATYTRNYTAMKYLGTTRAVTWQASIVRPAHGPIVAQETVNGTAWIIRQLERALMFGDSTKVPVQFDGLERIISTGAPNPALNVFDLRGRPLSEDVVNDGALVLKSEPNYGRGTDLYMADGAFGDLAKQFYPMQRLPIQPQGGWANGMVGLNIKGMWSQFGPIAFNPSTFIQFGPLASASATGVAGKVASAPTESVAPAAGALGGGETSYFAATDAGDYRYRVAAFNRYGRSASVAMTGPVTVAANQKVTMTVADGAVAGTAFELYRSDVNGAAGTERLCFTAARTGATTVLTDFNRYLPGMSKAFLLQNNLDFWAFKQLSPFTKIPLATIDASIRWMQLIAGAPQVYAPGRGLLFINVGRAPASAGLNNAALNSLY